MLFPIKHQNKASNSRTNLMLHFDMMIVFLSENGLKQTPLWG